MALVKTDGTIVSIRGRFGGVYFKTGKPGIHIQAMPRHVYYTMSKLQFIGVEAFSTMAAYWLMALAMAFGAAWATFALIYIFIDDEGESKRISGYNWFMHYAMMFPEADRPPFWKPPHAPYELPNFLVTYRGMWTYEHTPPEHPDWSPFGYYWYWGIYAETPLYKTDDSKWFLWWKDGIWVISPGPDFEPPEKTFYSPGPEIKDYYYNPFRKVSCHVYVGGG